jgi:hypothetical protein
VIAADTIPGNGIGAEETGCFHSPPSKSPIATIPDGSTLLMFSGHVRRHTAADLERTGNSPRHEEALLPPNTGKIVETPRGFTKKDCSKQ